MRQIRYLEAGVSAWLLMSAGVSAIPLFNNVNGVDVNGKQCPLPTKYDAECPQLCVPNQSQCPAPVARTCGSGLQFCNDGTCKPSCEGVKNICMCGDTGAIEVLFPCKSGMTLDIEYYNNDTQIMNTCARALGLSVVRSYDLQSKEPMWLKCPTAAKEPFTWREPMWVSVWALAGGYFGLLMLWILYKRIREKGINSVPESNNPTVELPDKSSKMDSAEGLEKPAKPAEDWSDNSSEGSISEQLVLKGYRRDVFGLFMFTLTIAYCIGMFVWLAVLTADYYGALTGKEFDVYLGFKMSSAIFIAVWYATAIVVLALNISRLRIRNFFRLQSAPRYGQWVQVEKQQQALILLEDNSQLLQLVRRIESILKRAFGWDVIVNTVPLERTEDGTKYFNFQCTRYVYNEATSRFDPYQFDYLGSTNAALLEHAGGLSQKEASFRLELIGPNFISVYVPNFAVALAQEFFGYFYLYQFMVLWLFYYYSYYYIGIADTVVILLSALVKVVIRLRSERRVKQMAEHVDLCKVLRDSRWKEISTADLVPGDVLEVKEGTVVPCDGVILSGNVVVDESSLTGEPLPVRKFPLKEDDIIYDRMTSGKVNTVFAGTTVTQAAPQGGYNTAPTEGDQEERRVTALVTHTGTLTDKGQLVQKILFPSPISFIFNEQIKIVMIILLIWAVILFVLAVWLQRSAGTGAWFFAMFNICQLISPILPAALVVGQSVAAGRLRTQHIYCVDLPRVIIAGKVRIFCFDKTGTLTKEGLEFYGAIAKETSSSSSASATSSSLDEEKRVDVRERVECHRFGERTEAMGEMPYDLRMGLATCHSVTEVGGQLIGNPVDIEMFNATGWHLLPNAEHPEFVDSLAAPSPLPPDQGSTRAEEPEKTAENRHLVHIVRRFEFVHARASMSVAVLDRATGRCHVFVKGSFEKIRELSNPDSIPADYDRITSRLAREGCYVLAIAHRDLGLVDDLDRIRNWTRDELEQDVDFLGLILFKNKLKEDTTAAISALKSGDTRTVMITGDNALTGIFIARQCGMVPEGQRILLADVGPKGELVWTDVDVENEADAVVEDGEIEDAVAGGGVELAVTGKAFNHFLSNNRIRSLLLHVRVFARMTPHGKVRCVQLHMERGITAMCGDGGNDCGALRAAHVGLALSEAEASIVSPFSTNKRTIMSCVELLRQGRAALATNFAAYRYLILYGQNMVMLKTFTGYFSVAMPQWLSILVDGFITVALSFAVTQARAAPRLAPKRPTARILGAEILTSTIGQVLINWIFLIGATALLYSQDWFRCREFDSSTVDTAKWWLLGDNFETETLALVVLFQWVNAAFVVNLGYVFRAAWWRNWILIFFWAAYIGIVSYVELADPNPLGCAFRMNCGNPSALQRLGLPAPWWGIEKYNINLGHNVLPREFRFKLWGLSIANMLAAVLFELFVVLGPVRNYATQRHSRKRLQLKL
ncbi:uncharacterized protein VTP21DRAFT_11537 [Calcarisporiella thermophila]|uniref:uncharacterized protein n=1 Tax=Calcarisporiella thermophila TaxID=911321 RepID=UPI003743C801